jgi:CRISPR-associated endonuclease/helicase Cas3
VTVSRVPRGKKIGDELSATLADTTRAQFLLDFWGKASPTNPAGISTHSIVYHSLDVAAVGAELIYRDRGRLTRIAAATGIEFATLRSALPFLLALHDIGKYSRVFQAKSSANWPTILGPYRQIPPGNSHVITGFQMLVEFSDDGAVRDIFDSVLPGWRAPTGTLKYADR